MSDEKLSICALRRAWPEKNASSRSERACISGGSGTAKMFAMTYTHGHHESVLRSHSWRTAENSAGYLLPHLEPGMRLLDVGCGPGTITLDLARSWSHPGAT